MVYSSLIDAAGRRVVVTVVDPGFLDAFKLGPGHQLSADLSMAAADSKMAQVVANRYPDGEFSLKLVPSPGLPAQLKAELDELPPVTQKLNNTVFEPRSTLSDHGTQFYASPDWVVALGPISKFHIPPVDVILKVRPNVEMEIALRDIQAVLDSHPSPFIFPGNFALARALVDAHDTDKTRRALLLAGHWIPLAMAVALALCALAMTWLRFRALTLELALRRSFCQSQWAAALHTLRPELMRLGAATLAACVIAWLWFAVQGHPWAAPKLWPAAVGGVALGASLAVLLARVLVRRPTALLLKSQTD